MNCLPKVMILISFFLLSFASNLNSVDAESFYGPSSPVVVLASPEFNNTVNSDKIFLVEFYGTWCGYCKALTPIWEKIATVLNGVVTVAAIDIGEFKDIQRDYQIGTVPNIKIFVPGKPFADYGGARELVPVVEFAHQQARQLLLERLNA